MLITVSKFEILPNWSKRMANKNIKPIDYMVTLEFQWSGSNRNQIKEM